MKLDKQKTLSFADRLAAKQNAGYDHFNFRDRQKLLELNDARDE